MPDGYAIANHIPVPRYPLHGVVGFSLFGMLECATLTLVIRPWSYRRSWGRAFVALLLFLPWSLLSLAFTMHMPPVVIFHAFWTLLVSAGLLVTLVITVLTALVDSKRDAIVATDVAVLPPRWKPHFMTVPTFQPGFRISSLDIGALVAGTAGALLLADVDRWQALAVAFVVAHFFLFCNIVRMDRLLELVWAGLFVLLASATLLGGGLVGWTSTFAIALACTAILVAVQARKPSYHGVFRKQINPGLLAWWEWHRRQT